jgi:uncharacterized Tic20 family protein
LMICAIPLSIVVGIILGIIGGELMFTLIRIWGYAMNLIQLGLFGLVIYGMVQARKGKLLRYPLNFRLIK